MLRQVPSSMKVTIIINKLEKRSNIICFGPKYSKSKDPKTT